MTDYVHDQGDLEDKIVLLHEQLDKAHEKKEKQLNRLKVAQEKYHASQQIVDDMQSDIALQAISGLEGQTSSSMRVSTDDLLESDDLYSVRDRLLELKLLNKDLLVNINDARKVARTWKGKADKADVELREKTDEIDAAPAHESRTIVEAKKYEVEARTELSRVEDEKLTLTHEFEQENLASREEVDTLELQLSAISTEYNSAQRNIRKYKREILSTNTSINCLHERKQFFVDKLKPLVGDDQVLQIAFDRYDTDASTELDKDEVLNALNELHRIDPSGPPPTIEAVEKFILDVDEDGSGTVNFKEFKEAFNRIMCQSIGARGGKK